MTKSMQQATTDMIFDVAAEIAQRNADHEVIQQMTNILLEALKGTSFGLDVALVCIERFAATTDSPLVAQNAAGFITAIEALMARSSLA